MGSVSAVFLLLLGLAGEGESYGWSPRDPQDMFCYTTAGGENSLNHARLTGCCRFGCEGRGGGGRSLRRVLQC